MRTNVMLRISFTITALWLMIIGLSACGNQPANNSIKTNGNGNAANTSVNSAANTEKSPAAVCNPAKDAAIISAMKGGIMPNTPLYDRRMHFNFHVSGCNVDLVGYLDDIRYFKQLYEVAAKNNDVQRIDISNLWLTDGDVAKPANGVCPGNGVKCNDICLPEGQVCNMLQEAGSVGSPKPSASKKP